MVLSKEDESVYPRRPAFAMSNSGWSKRLMILRCFHSALGFSSAAVMRLTFATVLTIFLCSLPIFLRIPFSNRDLGNAPIYSAMESLSFKYSLVVSTAISIPVMIDFALSSISSSFVPGFQNGSNFRVILLAALVIPDLFIFFYVIPNMYPELLSCIIQIRVVVCSYSIAGHYLLFGGPCFHSYQMHLVVFFSFSATVLICWQPFTIYGNFLFYSYLCSQGLASYYSFVVIRNWSKEILSKPLYEMTAAQISCIIYMIPTMVSVFAYIGIYSYKQSGIDGNTVEGILTSMSYLEAFFTIFMSVLHSHISDKEVNHHQRKLNQKQMFVRYVSHEIRTPLNTVLIGLDLLKTEIVADTKVAASTIEELKLSCNIAVEILNDLLHYEKLEAGIMTLEKIAVPASTFVIDAVTPFTVQARSKGIELVFPLSLESVPLMLRDVQICIDEAKMNQVVRNLVSNALKFTPAGGVVTISMSLTETGSPPPPPVEREGRRASLRLSSLNSEEELRRHQIHPEHRTRTRSPTTDPNLFFRIEIADTGAGIAPENVKKLFHNIIQFNPGKLQHGGGSGLGLFISKGIADLHGGSLSVFSKGEGFGSTFTLTIPLQKCAPEPSARGIHLGSLEISSRPIEISFASSSQSRRLHKSPTQATRLESIGHRFELHHDEKNDNIQMPVSSSKDNTTRYSKSYEVYDPKAPRDLSQLRVLAVDDAVVNLKMTCRGLRARGYVNICQAADGVEALAAYAKSLSECNPYHVIIMDYQMPNMDGPTASKHLRELGFNGKIIGLTGNALKADIEHFISNGADIVLTKPTEITKLDGAIQTLCMC